MKNQDQKTCQRKEEQLYETKIFKEKKFNSSENEEESYDEINIHDEHITNVLFTNNLE